MRQIGIAVVIAVIFALIPITGGGTFGPFYLGIPVIIAVGLAAAFKKSPRQSATIAAALGFGAILAFGVVESFFVKGSSPSCDGFCMTRMQARFFVLFLATVYGSVVAVFSALVAAFVCRGNVDVASR